VLARALESADILARAELQRASVLLAVERLAEARSALEDGLALARPMPYPYREGRLLHDDGMLQVQQGRRGQARERLEAALAVFRRLSAHKDAERTEYLLAALG
jgi:hypothetical protein